MGANRLDRVRELLKRELGEIIRRELPVEEVGVITVNHVDISSDLHSAVVYISTIGNPTQKSNAVRKLYKKSGYIQSILARSIVLKHSPKLKFFTDDSIQKGDKVLEILNELETSTPPVIPYDSTFPDDADPNDREA